MLPVREAILKCLQKHSDDDDSIVRELHRIAEEFGGQSYPILLHILTHLDFDPKEAESLWNKIIRHWQHLEEALNRKISLRTAVCDFFCSVDRSLKNPKVVEIHVFEETAHSSKFDALTGLVNRGFFDDTLERELARARRHKVSLSVLFFDLDNFKKLNDTHGHLGGDAVLKSVARIINEEKRTEDLAARYGGEEMVLILPDTEKIQALTLGERIRRRVSESAASFEGESISVTLSGGLACFPIDAEEASKLLDCADKALYHAKGSGKNNIALYSQDKRRYLRIDYNNKISVKELEQDILEESKQPRGKNLSMTGILFQCEQALPMGTKLHLEIPITSEETINLTGTIVRVENLENGLYDIGISFIQMEPRAQNQISRYITEFLENPSVN